MAQVSQAENILGSKQPLKCGVVANVLPTCHGQNSPFRAPNMWYAFQDNRSGQTIATSHDLGLQNGTIQESASGRVMVDAASWADCLGIL